MQKFLIAAAFALAAAFPAYAQVASAPNVTISWLPLGKISAGISVTTSPSAATSLPSGGDTVYVFNSGSEDAFVAIGGNAVAASTTSGGSTLVKAGTCANVNRRNSTGILQNYISAVTASNTTTLAVETGIGAASCSGGGSSLGGTVAQGNAGSNPQAWWVRIGDSTNGPAAVAPAGADSASNTQAGITDYSRPSWFNGTTWDRARGDATNGVYVQGKSSESHVGEVGSNIFPISNAMTTANATTTTGQSIGGLQTLANAVRVSGALGAGGTGGMIQSVMVTFKDAIGSGPLDVYYFNANPTGSTCTNNSAFVLADADRDKVIGIAHVSDFTSSNTAVISQAQNQAMPFGVASSTSIYACVVARASFAITGTANASLITRIFRN